MYLYTYQDISGDHILQDVVEYKLFPLRIVILLLSFRIEVQKSLRLIVRPFSATIQINLQTTIPRKLIIYLRFL